MSEYIDSFSELTKKSHERITVILSSGKAIISAARVLL